MARSLKKRNWRSQLGFGRRPDLSSRRQIKPAGAAIMSALVLLAVGAAVYFSGVLPAFMPRQSEVGVAAAPAPPDHRVGAIMFVPPKGPLCEIHRFDNVTGQVLPSGFVNCERMATDESKDPMGPGSDRGARLRAIVAAFKK